MSTRLQLAGEARKHVATISVVLADGHGSIRRSLRQLLDGEPGIEVIAEADDIGLVQHHVEERAPRVLVLDLELPTGSSLEAIRRLRQAAPDTQIVVMTMEDSPALARHVTDAGALGFVLKERADTELPAAVKAAVRGDEFVSPRVAASLAAIRAAAGRDGLSQRETEVLRLIALGFTSAEIGRDLDLSRRTVETHRANILRKLGLRTRAQLVAYALRRHLIGC